jgi:hypothetical protein
MFHYDYVAFKTKVKTDAGRIRNEEFFKKVYGTTAKKVEQNLKIVTWCPKLANTKLKVTTINGIDKKIEAISKELDTKKHLKKYIDKVGGTFLWRKISGTSRLSNHSFGMTLDINT